MKSFFNFFVNEVKIGDVIRSLIMKEDDNILFLKLFRL